MKSSEKLFKTKLLIFLSILLNLTFLTEVDGQIKITDGVILTDGRDADIFIENNAGIEDKNPNCKINVVNNALATTCGTAGNWYKANWINTSSITTKFLITNNRITYQSQNTRSIYIIVSGNVSVDAAGENITESNPDRKRFLTYN